MPSDADPLPGPVPISFFVGNFRITAILKSLLPPRDVFPGNVLALLLAD